MLEALGAHSPETTERDVDIDTERLARPRADDRPFDEAAGVALVAHGIDGKGLRAFNALRQRLFAIDVRFGQVDSGLFDSLDRQGSSRPSCRHGRGHRRCRRTCSEREPARTSGGVGESAVFRSWTLLRAAGRASPGTMRSSILAIRSQRRVRGRTESMGNSPDSGMAADVRCNAGERPTR